jgi:hypothetical protein
MGSNENGVRERGHALREAEESTEGCMLVHVYTAHREWYHGRDRVDLTTITARSRAFICANITQCSASRGLEQRTREEYLAFLRHSYRTQRPAWQTALARIRLVFVCTCPPGMRTCRRYVLADVFGKLGACLGGELREACPPMPVTRAHRRSA